MLGQHWLSGSSGAQTPLIIIYIFGELLTPSWPVFVCGLLGSIGSSCIARWRIVHPMSLGLNYF